MIENRIYISFKLVLFLYCFEICKWFNLLFVFGLIYFNLNVSLKKILVN